MRSISGWFISAIQGMGYLLLFVPSVAAQQPETVLFNGKILTVDSQFSIAEAIAITGNKITAVGTSQEVLRQAGPNTLTMDLKGRTVVPGLIDTHAHIHNYAEGAYGANEDESQRGSYSLDFRGVRNKDDVLQQIKGVLEKYRFKPGEWVSFESQLSLRGGGAVEVAKILYEDLNRWELDTVAPNNPIAMTMGFKDENGLLVNSKAIEVLWGEYGDFIKRYGRYWVNAAGTPDGHLEGPPATRLAMKFLPQYSRPPEGLAPIYKQYLEELAATGVTAVSTRLPTESVKAYELLESKGEMTLRLAYGMEDFFGDTLDLESGLKSIAALMGKGSDTLWVTSAGANSVDRAANGACTAQKRSSPYGAIDAWYPSGVCHFDIEFRGAKGKGAPIQGNYFREWVVQSGLNGVRFANTHVAGDRSVELLLNIIEDIQRQKGPSATQGWAMDHCAFVNPRDFQRAARLGVMFSCAPKYVADNAPEAAKAYGEQMVNTFIVPVQSMLDAGVKVVFEADRDVYQWSDLELLMTRKDKTGKVWGPQERVDKATALKMITRWAADYLLKPDQLGSLETGKRADLVVLDRDYLTIPEDEISEIRPQMTIFDGKILYVHQQFAAEYSLRPAGAMVTTYEQLKARRPARMAD